MAGSDGDIAYRITIAGIEEAKGKLKELTSGAVEAFHGFGETIAGIGEKAAGMFGELGEPLKKVIELFKEGAASAESFGARLAGLSAAVTGVGAALVTLATHSSSAVVANERMAQRIGTTSEAYEKFKFALASSGVATEQVMRLFSQLDSQMEKTAKSGGDASTVLGRLGIDVGRIGDLRDPIEVFKDIADKFQGINDGATKTAAAVELFGKRFGPMLVPLLNQGAEGIDRLMGKAEALGVTFTHAESEMAFKVMASFRAMNTAIESLSEHFGLLFGPAAVSLYTGVLDLIQTNREAIMAWGADIAKVANQIAADILNAFKGNDKDIQFGWILAIKQTLELIGGLITTFVMPAFKALEGVANLVAAAFNKVFGTNIAGDTILLVGALTLLTLGFKRTEAAAIFVVTAFTKIVEAIALLSVAIVRFGIAMAAAMVADPVLALFVAIAAGAVALGVYAVGWDNIKNAIMEAMGIGKEAVLGTTDETHKATEATNTHAAAVSSLRAKWTDAAAGTKEFAAEADKARQRIDLLIESLNKQKSGDSGMSQVAPEAQKAGEAIQTVGTAADEAANKLKTAGTDGGTAMDNLKFAASQAQSETSGFFSNILLGLQNIIDLAGQALAALNPISQAKAEPAPTPGGGLGGDAAGAQAVTQQMEAAARAIDFVNGGLESLKLLANEALASLAEKVAPYVAALEQIGPAWDDAATTAGSAAGSMVSALQAIERAARDAADAIAAIPARNPTEIDPTSGGANQQGAAGGGYIRGPGSGTSDSILARLSDREFVLRARATDYYGPGVFAAFNSMRIPRDALYAMLSSLKGFSAGGMVETAARVLAVPIPGFAAGGAVRAATVGSAAANQPNILNLTIGSEQFNGLLAPAGTFAALSRYATSKKNTSTGRKPSWMR